MDQSMPGFVGRLLVHHIEGIQLRSLAHEWRSFPPTVADALWSTCGASHLWQRNEDQAAWHWRWESIWLSIWLSAFWLFCSVPNGAHGGRAEESGELQRGRCRAREGRHRGCASAFVIHRKHLTSADSSKMFRASS